MGVLVANPQDCLKNPLQSPPQRMRYTRNPNPSNPRPKPGTTQPPKTESQHIPTSTRRFPQEQQQQQQPCHGTRQDSQTRRRRFSQAREEGLDSKRESKYRGCEKRRSGFRLKQQAGS
ncbi:hypothetical protein OIU84_000170 [Salix udensis]|uniref:Uncharacterized protein n=1 Tax=Salix udensis TaxID=889485 RepID=A0AAD6L463_9ROSI|nr:hypothetical protein OIU84_000170 [Salix udensis]